MKNILIINLGGIGDFLLSTPALRALRDLYPDSAISVLVSEKMSEIARDLPYVNKVYTFGIGYGGKVPFLRLFRNFKTLLSLRRKKFDIAINMRTLVTRASARKMRSLFFIINPGIKVGRDTEGLGYFYDIKISETKIGQKYEMEYDLDLVRALGAEVVNKSIDFKINPASERKIRDILERHKIKDSDVVIGLHPGGMPSRRWPVENFARVMRDLNNKMNVKFVITGGKEEDGLAKNLIKQSKVAALELNGRLNLKELAALIRKCKIYIANDTGPMHIAAILKTPLIAIFGPGDITRFDPRNISDKAIVLYKKAYCTPCNNKECNSLECLTAITIQEVIDTVMDLLKERER